VGGKRYFADLPSLIRRKDSAQFTGRSGSETSPHAHHRNNRALSRTSI
jgi:hypothetical protein